MTRFEKTKTRGYEIGNDHATEVYDKIMKKHEIFRDEFFAPVEKLYGEFSRLHGVEWLETTPEAVQGFVAWIQEEV